MPPRSSFEALYARMALNIAASGQHLQGVFPTQEDPGPFFTYTIGNHDRELPEIINIGVAPNGIAPVLNWVSDEQRRRGKALLGDVKTEGAEHGFRLVDVSGTTVREDWTVQAGQYYRWKGMRPTEAEGYRVTQLIVPDLRGRFPGDPDCEEPYASQVLL